MIGKTISHYKILEKLGGGGMGIVYKAQDLKLDRFVALKFLPPELGRDEQEKKRFVLEAKAASAIEHKNICIVHEIGETEDGQLFIAMAYYDGETLKQKISRSPLPIKQALEIGIKICAGLARAHEKKVVHRDIKPANVMFTVRDEVRVMDFGLAKLAGSVQLTNTGSTVGTVAYMSPEQARGQKVDHRTDVWSFGALLYEMITGREPFKGEKAPAVLRAILEDEPEPITGLRSGVPMELERVVNKCLTKEPGKRYQHMDEIAVDLQAVLEDIESGRRPVRVSQTGLSRLTKRSMVVSVAALLLFLSTAIMYILQLRSKSSTPSFTNPQMIAVLPFSWHGRNDYAYLADAMVYLLSTGLDGAGELRRVAPGAVMGMANRENNGTLDPKRGLRLAERLGAGQFVLGNIVEIGGGIQINASLYTREHGRDPVAEATVKGDAIQIFTLTDELATELLSKLGKGASAHIRGVAAFTSSSLDAYKAYLEGEGAFRRGHFVESLAGFERAVQLDSQFALAYYRLSIALEWCGRPNEQIKKAADLAFRYADRLTDRDRGLLEAMRVWRRGANQEAKKHYETFVHNYPNEIEAWFQLGEVLFHTNPLYGSSFTNARAAFERVLFYKSDYAPSILHLIRIAAFEVRLTAMDSLLQKYVELTQEDSETSVPMRSLAVFSLKESQEETIALLRQAKDVILVGAFMETSLYSNNLAGAEDIARLLIEPSRPLKVRSFGRIALAHLHLAQGRWASAKKELEAIRSFDPWPALEYSALFSVLPFLPVPKAELIAIREQLAQAPLATFTINQHEAFIGTHDHLHQLLRSYLVGLLSARLGESKRAEQSVLEIKNQDFHTNQGTFALDLAVSIRAQLELSQGRLSDALEKLQGILKESVGAYESPFLAEAYERFTKAEILYKLGRHREALAWYEHLAEVSCFTFLYLPISHLRRGEIYDHFGETEKAIEHYNRFVELWEGCDAELQPMLQRAQKRISILKEISKK